MAITLELRAFYQGFAGGATIAAPPFAIAPFDP